MRYMQYSLRKTWPMRVLLLFFFLTYVFLPYDGPFLKISVGVIYLHLCDYPSWLL